MISTPTPGGGGTQIWIGRVCAAGSSEPIPMFRGNFFPKKVPMFRDFSEKRYPFFAIFSKFSGVRYVLKCEYPPGSYHTRNWVLMIKYQPLWLKFVTIYQGSYLSRFEVFPAGYSPICCTLKREALKKSKVTCCHPYNELP